MDRSQEKVLSSQAKLQTLDQSANIHQKVHENQAAIIGVNRTTQRKISNESAIETLAYVDGRNGIEGLNNRKPEQLISPLQTQYFHTGVSGMGLPPYLSAQAMDHRGLGNLFYRHSPVHVFPPGYTGAFTQRMPGGEDIREPPASVKSSERSENAHEPKEPVRTESVIKIAAERTDLRQPDTVDKRQSRPTNDDYARTNQERNGDHVAYRGLRDKSDVTSNGDIRHSVSMERTFNDLRSYQPPSISNKGIMPGSYVKDYTKSDYARVPSSQGGMFSSMPKLTPIAPRGHPSSPFSSAPAVTDDVSRSSTGALSVRPPTTVYHPGLDKIPSENMVARRGDSRPDDDLHRANYLSRSVYENVPGYWERDVASRYPGHSAYQGYGYGRAMPTKRPEDKENTKEIESGRTNPRQTDSVNKDAAISPDRTSHYHKDATKQVSENTIGQGRDHGSSLAVTSQNEPSLKNQVTLSKSEKPVLPDNVRYKVADEKKNTSKSDKVTVYPKQGMAYAVSVRKTPLYYANGGRNSDIVDPHDRGSHNGFDPTVGSKKEESQQSSVKDKTSDNSDGDFSRRRFEQGANERRNYDQSSYDESKKSNDKNNNSSFSSFSRYQSQTERSRPANKISLGQDKVFVPPNITLEMFEKREQEMEREAASCRSSVAIRSTELAGTTNKTKGPGKKDADVDSRYHSPPEQTNIRQSSNKLDTSTIKSDSNSKGSDDEELKIIEERASTQTRINRQEESKRTLSPRLSRMTSPNVSNAANNPPYLTPFGVNFPVRRTPSESEMVARENAERSLQAAYLYGGGLPFPSNAAQFMASGGRGDMPVMLPMEMFYGGMYKSHMMDPANQGGAVMQDPLTGSLVVVPEALLNQSMFNPLAAAAAESQLMVDPRFLGMQTPMEDPRWQQLYQQQAKHFYEQMEKYKHEMLLAQQQGRLSGYPFSPFYHKQFEAQKKQEEELAARLADQRPKSREEPVTKPRAEKPDDLSSKDKPPSKINERRSSYQHDSRRETESDNKTDMVSQRSSQKPEKAEPLNTSNTDKMETLVSRDTGKPEQIRGMLEKRRISEERLQQQEEQKRQFQQYMLREPVLDPSTKFPFSRNHPPLPKSIYSPTDVSPRDHPRDARDIPLNSSRYIEASRPEVSPQVVSAAATLANMDIGTRFPFSSKPFKQSDERFFRGTEQSDPDNKKTGQTDHIVKDEHVPNNHSSSTDRASLDSKIDVSIPRRSSHELQSTNQVNKEPIDRHSRDGFDVLSLIRDSPRSTKNSFAHFPGSRASYNETDTNRHSVAVEPSRLLVAKAEKLSQDEELEVIRIDTPHAVPRHLIKEEKNISDQKNEDMDLLLSMAKEGNDSLESPSSKSEIFWIECSDVEEDYEVQAINDSVRPIKVEYNGHNKENSIMLSLQSTKSEEEKKIIREKIEKLREIAKGRTREERFTALTRQKEMKSPSSIVNSVTASLNEVLDTNVMEKDIRMRLAELQKKYREKHRELARLQPRGKHGNDEHSGKSTPIKRGPGRPRKRKYFGASSKSDKSNSSLLTFNDVTETSIKSEASTPSDPPSPSLKSIMSEDMPVFKEAVEQEPERQEQQERQQPVKKKKKKSSVSKKEDAQTPTSPRTVSPTTLEVKPRVKTSRKSSTSSSKSKSTNSSVPLATSAETSNIQKLFSAISPMFNDNSNQEPVYEPNPLSINISPNNNVTDTSPSNVPTNKPKTSKKSKKAKKEKQSSTDESSHTKGSVSSNLSSPDIVNTASTKNSNTKSPKKPKKKSKTQSTSNVNSEFIFPESVNNVEQKKSLKKKDAVEKFQKDEKKQEQDDDDVFTGGSGALDLLANFASSASFEKHKQPEGASPSTEGSALKGMKRGRPKKPYSPTPESDPSTTSPKKKRKKKKLSVPVPKSPKKISSSSEEKENVIVKPDVPPAPQPVLVQPMEQPPTLPPSPPVEPCEIKEEPIPVPLEEQIVKIVKEEITQEVIEPSTEDEDVPPEVEPVKEATPPPESIKEKRRKSRTSIAKELDETRQAFALYGDWQPRRSERIFINSSVTPQSSADLSPLSSPTSKTSDFSWTKKTKKLSKVKKPSKSDEVSDSEPTKEDSPVISNKAVIKAKKKKSPGKGKKRRSSSTTDPDFVLRTPKRKAAKRDRSYEELDEEDDEDMVDDGEENQDDDEDKDTENQEDAEEESIEISSTIVAKQNSRNDKTDDKENVRSTEDELEEEEINKADDESSSDAALVESKKEDPPSVTFDSIVDPPQDGKKENSSVDMTNVAKEEDVELEKELLPRATFSESTSSDETAIAERRDLPPEPVISFTKEELKDNTKMLLPVDRVFFRGRITFFQEPDLYGVVLPGERGRRPHLRSTEQLLSQAVKDIIPPAVEYLPVGTRVCAHWSPQYRCFYPGNVIETPPDEKSEPGKLWVEFDDGDSGIFPLSDLRKIITEGPVQVDDVESDVVLPERRAHFSSSRGSSPTSRRPKEQEISPKTKDEDTSGWESTEDAPIRRTRGRGKRRSKLRDRAFSEEATDSDAPRGNQDTDDEESAEQADQGKKNDSEDKIDDPKLVSLQTKKTKRRNRVSIEEPPDHDAGETPSEGLENKNQKTKTEKSKESKVKQSKRNEDDTDEDEPIQEPGTVRFRSRSSRLSELDLRKKSLTLNLNSSPRSRVAGSESPAQDSTSQDEDSGSCSEVFDDSPQTENKTFQSRFGKRRRSALDRNKQDKSSGELWAWSGKNHQNKRKGKGRKVFYKTIVRGDDTISAGDCAVFTSNPSKSNNLPYVGKIESMWEGCSGNMVVRVKWFYHPEETKAGRKSSDAKHPLYRSTHVDEIDVQTISHKCEVVSTEEYKKRTQDTIGTRSTTTDRSDRLFTCVGTYDPSTEKIDN